MGIVGTSSSDTTALVNPLLGAYGVTQFSFGETQLRLSGPAYKAHVRAGQSNAESAWAVVELVRYFGWCASTGPASCLA